MYKRQGLPGLDTIRPQGEAEVRPVDVPIDVILGKPPRMTRDVRRLPGVSEPLDLAGIDLTEAAYRVLRHPTAVSYTHLARGGRQDRHHHLPSGRHLRHGPPRR